MPGRSAVPLVGESHDEPVENRLGLERGPELERWSGLAFELLEREPRPGREDFER